MTPREQVYAYLYPLAIVVVLVMGMMFFMALLSRPRPLVITDEHGTTAQATRGVTRLPGRR